MSAIAKSMVCALFMFAGVAAADDDRKGSNLGEATAEAKSPGSPALESAALANALADRGYDKKDPLMLFTAAQLLGEVEFVAADADQRTGPEGKSPAEDATKATGRDRSVSALLTAADAMAKEQGNASISQLIAASRESGTRGRSPVPVNFNTYRVNGNSEHTFRWTFRGHEQAVIVVQGDGDTDLDMHVYDENDNLVAQDVLDDDYPAVEFYPAWTGQFRVVVTNLGDVWNEYVIATN